MRILTLFFALFLTLLPESANFAPSGQGQDVCWEEVTDVEEEAVIRTEQRTQKQVQAIPSADERNSINCLFSTTVLYSIHYCFERQWLRYCRLRL